MKFTGRLGDLTLPAPRAEEWEWQMSGTCRDADSELFFEPRTELIEGHAKRICSGCPVLAECRQYAVDASEPHGIWGGLTPRERDIARRQRKWFTPSRSVG
ncbi:WhiB family transcriptional regulator [Rhodococcus sp. T2V]|uniref:WhiB family transcriptional regulator n=1 Tax=Rhodococcus sp. T2V TaxID=3034164 RepID=UPI0023E31E24|nr:WhiB family transcriptional regulator [Rhodococcus sp. T2V]MDF3310658.1 WhiB family transcriptional regulator [Rhodococcus sp. T2V]